eukprot:CAMPEP_0197898342 /NCGR_PEP_ID=MMETSP1439-20131203/43805_1 /TAXON_ID=66791 /ORGANISM="Gonyaulax spinifera, Strain CCMP409" /LENGTH=81 /DNA_ID=CAMNT_0043519049 /DNA_START=42 /DNA_END=287 /DNA_ORIENTATION=-
MPRHARQLASPVAAQITSIAARRLMQNVSGVSCSSSARHRIHAAACMVCISLRSFVPRPPPHGGELIGRAGCVTLRSHLTA